MAKDICGASHDSAHGLHELHGKERIFYKKSVCLSEIHPRSIRV